MVIVSLVASVDSVSITFNVLDGFFLKVRITYSAISRTLTSLSFFQVGTYRTTSLQVNSRPPTRGVVSRGIALEGLCSILAGLWGSGTGSTTLTENVHTINTTKVASRMVVELGAVFLIIFSFIGKATTLRVKIHNCRLIAALYIN
jgi:nucleobase transporter 1/2